METRYHFKHDTIYCGDNLRVLKYFPDECVDLIYIDPPFFSGKNYDLVFGDKYAIRAFQDTFEGKKETYLSFMEDRIRHLHRILKPTGSFYLHCDHHASHYLKVICDAIFNKENFKADIIWKRTIQVKNVKKNYSRNIDYILFYTKSNSYTFNTQYTPLRKEQIKKYYNNIEKETGRRYNHSGLTRKGSGINKLKFHDKGTISTPLGVSFGWSQETYEKEYKKNPLCIHWSKNNKPRKKIYLDEHKGIPLTILWDDIPELPTNSSERLGYPTQKPEALLERIIKASSNEKDIILDSFCGCGTSLVVAEKLNRKWIGIDVSPIGCTVMAKRIGYQLKNIQGMKYSLKQAKELDWMDFQKWTIKSIDGIPLTKKGADKGIDGWQNNNKFNESVPVEVKQHKINYNDVLKLNSVIEREKKKGGFMIAFEITKPASIEIKRLKRTTKRDIVFISFDDLFNRETLLKKGAIKPTMLERHFKVK